MSRNWFFPDRGFEYTRTPEFIAERFGKNPWDASMVLEARTPGEAIYKFRKYVEEGRLLGAYH